MAGPQGEKAGTEKLGVKTLRPRFGVVNRSPATNPAANRGPVFGDLYGPPLLTCWTQISNFPPRGWAGWAEAKGDKSSFGWKLDDPAFEQKAIDVMIGEKGFAEMFRAFHAKHGRWPTFEGIGPLGSPFVVGKRS